MIILYMYTHIYVYIHIYLDDTKLKVSVKDGLKSIAAFRKQPLVVMVVECNDTSQRGFSPLVRKCQYTCPSFPFCCKKVYQAEKVLMLLLMLLKKKKDISGACDTSEIRQS